MAGRPPDSASGRNFVRRGSQQRERLGRARVSRPQTHEDLQWMCVDEVTRRVAQMSEGDKRAAFQGSDYFSRHFPHLDPRRAGDPAAPAGPVMWLPRPMIVSFIRSWPVERRDRFFHEAPWMRADFPEFKPAGGWPPRLVYPTSGIWPPPVPVHGPPDLWEPDRDFRLRDVMDPATGEFVPCPPSSPPPEDRPRHIAWPQPYDPTRYRRGDFEPPPSRRAAGVHRRRDRRRSGYPQWARPQRRTEVDYGPYSPRGPCEEVWADNWTPAEGQHIPAFGVMSPQGY